MIESDYVRTSMLPDDCKMNPEHGVTPASSAPAAMREEDWVISRYVDSLNWLQSHIFEHYMDPATKQFRFRLSPNAAKLCEHLQGESLFGAALNAFDAKARS